MAGRLPHWPGRKASARPILPDKEPGAEIYSAATTRDQAKIVFGDAQTMARKDKAMQKYFGLTVQQHVMTVNSTGSVFRPLATEGNVNDGLNRHSPDSRPFQGQDRASDRLEQRQIAVAASKGPSKLMVDGGPTLKRAALLVPRCTKAYLSPHCRCTWLTLVMPARAVPAAERSATGCRRTSVATPRPRPSGRSHSARGSRPSRRS